MNSSGVLLAGCGELANMVARFLAGRGELAAILLPRGSAVVDGPPEARSVPVATWPADPTAFPGEAVDFIVSVGFPHRFPIGWLRLPRKWPLNLHLGYVPFNRGAAPWRWPLIDGSPAGVSLHVMDEGSDTGPYVYRHRLEVNYSDTAVTLRRRLGQLAIERFVDAWPGLRQRRLIPQEPGGSAHSEEDVRRLRVFTPAELRALDKLRAVVDGDGTFVARGGERFRLHLVPEAEPTVEPTPPHCAAPRLDR